MPDKEPPINIPQTELTNAGFTNSGSDRYNKSVSEYGKILFDKAVNYGEIDKATNANREVTHEHVKAAAHSIANSFGKPVKSKWIIPLQVGEFLCAAIVGLAGGHIDKTEGLVGFSVAFGLGAILFIIEKSISK
ncbi:hypothetical protein [Flavobacterium columnare]|uniref:hypothetical protein n=1 Tax=Flavobacterium columnare TaxID=996 RepID=UPI004033C571